MTESKIPRPMRICKHEECERKHYGRGYCKKHYERYITHGMIPKRSHLDPNEFIIDGDVCFIQLYNIKCKPTSRAIIDAEDLGLVKNMKWGAGGHGYIKNDVTHKMLANIIMHPVPNGYEVDHVDRDILNNRKSNLRYATRSQNNANALRVTNTSGFKGVCWHKIASKWMATIQYEKKQYYLGIFTKKEDAALAYNKKALELYGDFAVLNRVGKQKTVAI